MLFQTTPLKTIANCDNTLLAMNEKRDALSYRKTSLERNIADNSAESDTIPGEIAAVNTQIAAYNAILPSLPEGEDKDDILDELAMLENELLDLLDRSELNGIQAQVLKEFELAKCDRAIVLNAGFKTLVETRKGELPT
jgi:hypothetical protein